MSKINLKLLSKFIPIIGIILFIFIIYDIGIHKILNTFLLIPIYLCIIALILSIPRILILCYKWFYINKKQKINLDFKSIVKVFLISMYYGNITPAGVGWHIRILYLKNKAKITYEKAITNSFIDLFSGFIMGLFIALIGTIILIDKVPGFFPIILGFFLFYLSAFILLMKHTRGQKIIRFIIRPLLPKKFKENFDQSLDSLYENIPKIRDMGVPYLLEAIAWIIAGFQTFIIAQAFNVDIPIIIFILISSISVVVTGIIPISVGGLGVREGAFVFILHQYGVVPEIAFVISLAGYLVKMLIPSFLGMFYSFKEK